MQQAIVKVMQQEAKNKQKFNKAKTFCFNRLTDLRCEDRRRVRQSRFPPCQCILSGRVFTFVSAFWHQTM